MMVAPVWTSPGRMRRWTIGLELGRKLTTKAEWNMRYEEESHVCPSH
jgi:hypothetical protein